ncbi:transforming growth factor, beta receptor associated protein 1 [Phlyctochytrium planicorne]|nr:transforming growth factor, beta receptor associated protein 1 [Phlyctochytrium planicorne]
MDPFLVVQLIPSLGSYADDAAASVRPSLFAKSSSFGGGGASTPGTSSPNLPGTPNSGRGGIECLDLFEKNLFLGTSDGYVLHYHVEERQDEVVGQLRNKKMISTGRKPIEGIAVIPKEERLIVLSDSAILFINILNLQTLSLSSAQALRGITSFAIDQSTESPFRISVAKRRILQSIRITDQPIIEKEIGLADGALAMCRYNQIVCAADTQNYKMLKFADGETITLFPYDRTVSKPLICSVGKGEFLLVIATNQQGLGMFVNSKGDAIRGTLQWPSVPKSVAFHFPYIISLLKNSTVEIHNLFSQELIQTIPIPPSMDARFLSNALRGLKLTSIGATQPSLCKIVVRCRDTVVGLKMKAIDEQLREMLDAGLVERAIKMAEDMVNSDVTIFDTGKLRQLCRTAGLMHLRDSLFDDAFTMFQKGALNPLALISMFPAIAPFPNVHDRLLAMAGEEGFKAFEEFRVLGGSIEELVKAGLERNYPNADEDTMTSFMQALVANAKEIRTAQVKLYCEASNIEAITAILASGPVQVDDCEEFMKLQKSYYAVVQLYKFHGLAEKGLEVWFQQLDVEGHDEKFESVDEMTDLLDGVRDQSVFLQYLRPAIQRDVTVVFKRKTAVLGDIDSAEMLEVLQPLGPSAEILYLEYLVHDKGRKDPATMMRLAALYLEDLLKDETKDGLKTIDENYADLETRPLFVEYLEDLSRKEGVESVAVVRLSFLRLIMNLTSGDDGGQKGAVEGISKKVLAADGLHFEKAVLKSKVSDQDEDMILRLLAQRVQDFITAERYCLTGEILNPWAAEVPPPTPVKPGQTKKAEPVVVKPPRKDDSELLLTLVSLYLDNSDASSSVQGFREAMRLLSVHARLLDPIKVMRLIPPQCSLNTAFPFISSSLRNLISQNRFSAISKNIVRSKHVEERGQLVEIQMGMGATLVDGQSCLICRKGVVDPSVFVRLPGDRGDLVHLHCLRRPGE